MPRSFLIKKSPFSPNDRKSHLLAWSQNENMDDYDTENSSNHCKYH